MQYECSEIRNKMRTVKLTKVSLWFVSEIRLHCYYVIYMICQYCKDDGHVQFKVVHSLSWLI